mmetsp:Transcript_107289/g.268998  ORF Transcript_107289/g.268998 Transcript_107289/m.268998 type:complete len:242 (+) Transcript_107289:325-1050(+)
MLCDQSSSTHSSRSVPISSKGRSSKVVAGVFGFVSPPWVLDLLMVIRLEPDRVCVPRAALRSANEFCSSLCSSVSVGNAGGLTPPRLSIGKEKALRMSAAPDAPCSCCKRRSKVSKSVSKVGSFFVCLDKETKSRLRCLAIAIKGLSSKEQVDASLSHFAALAGEGSSKNSWAKAWSALGRSFGSRISMDLMKPVASHERGEPPSSPNALSAMDLRSWADRSKEGVTPRRIAFFISLKFFA